MNDKKVSDYKFSDDDFNRVITEDDQKRLNFQNFIENFPDVNWSENENKEEQNLLN